MTTELPPEGASLPDDEHEDQYWMIEVARHEALDRNYVEEEQGTVQRWDAKLFFETEEGPQTQFQTQTHVVGRASFRLHPDARFSSSFWDLCDEESGDLALIAESLMDKDGRAQRRLFSGITDDARAVLIIDRVHIVKKFRGQGLGSEFVRRAIECILGSTPAVVTAYPAPVAVSLKKRTPEHWLHIRGFWTNVGFVHFQDGVFVAPHGGMVSHDAERERFRDDLQQWKKRVRRPLPKGKP
ncbi:hypothetical protein [Microcella sp.]|uniref:hypothetical protein n=1 Tax=Microcella sp. TaxID=1913979 RepID=UPI003F6FFE56